MPAISLSLLRSWTMICVDTGEEIVGQFEGEDLAERPGAPAYSGHTSLSRQNEVLQFLHGQADRVSFRARVFAASVAEEVKTELDTLKRWLKVDERAKRPPIIVFLAGSGDIYIESVLESLGDIVYDRLTAFGGVRGATFSVTLRQYVPFQIMGEYLHETRYARAQKGDYYEMLALREYGDPALGVLVGRRHEAVYLEPGDVVKLPSVDALEPGPVRPASVPFYDSDSEVPTPTKDLRAEFLAMRGHAYVSHVLR